MLRFLRPETSCEQLSTHLRPLHVRFNMPEHLGRIVLCCGFARLRRCVMALVHPAGCDPCTRRTPGFYSPPVLQSLRWGRLCSTFLDGFSSTVRFRVNKYCASAARQNEALHPSLQSMRIVLQTPSQEVLHPPPPAGSAGGGAWVESKGPSALYWEGEGSESGCWGPLNP